MISPLVNGLAIILGSFIGLFLKKGIPERLTDGTMKALGLCVIYIGVTGLLTGSNTLLLIISLVVGTLIGELADLDLRIINLGNWVEKKLNREGRPTLKIADGFVTATLLFCVGAMAIVGSLQSGLTGNHETIFAKSILDFVAAAIFASTKGIGVAFSAVAVFIYQGSIVLLAGLIAPLLTYEVINEMSVIGSLVILALGLNVLGVTKIKVMNLVPSMFLPIILVFIF